MQNEFLPKPIETEADAQAARLVTERLNEITRRANIATRWYVLSGVALWFCWFAMILSPLLFGRRNPMGESIAFTFALIGSAAYFSNHWIRLRSVPKFDVEEIVNIGGIRAITPLFAALQNPAPNKQKQATYEALTLLLPQMKASDANLLTSDARSSIISLLKESNSSGAANPYPYPLRLAALKALEQVGDSTAIPAVEKLANTWPPARGTGTLYQAARECLPILRANCGDVETACALLRASHAEAACPNTLLRPASGAGGAIPQELLRPSNSDSTGP